MHAAHSRYHHAIRELDHSGDVPGNGAERRSNPRRHRIGGVRTMVVSRFARRLFRGMRKIAGDRRGTSAIEFAMVAPLFAAVVIPMVDVANFAAGVSQMESAVRSSIQYAMIGGTD